MLEKYKNMYLYINYLPCCVCISKFYYILFIYIRSASYLSNWVSSVASHTYSPLAIIQVYLMILFDVLDNSDPQKHVKLKHHTCWIPGPHIPIKRTTK